MAYNNDIQKFFVIDMLKLKYLDTLGYDNIQLIQYWHTRHMVASRYTYRHVQASRTLH